MLQMMLCCMFSGRPKRKWRSELKEIVKRMREVGWDCIVQPGPYEEPLQISAVYKKLDVYCIISYTPQAYCSIRFYCTGVSICASRTELFRVLSCRLCEVLDLSPEDTNDLTICQSNPQPS